MIKNDKCNKIEYYRLFLLFKTLIIFFLFLIGPPIKHLVEKITQITENDQMYRSSVFALDRPVAMYVCVCVSMFVPFFLKNYLFDRYENLTYCCTYCLYCILFVIYRSEILRESYGHRKLSPFMASEGHTCSYLPVIFCMWTKILISSMYAKFHNGTITGSTFFAPFWLKIWYFFPFFVHIS